MQTKKQKNLIKYGDLFQLGSHRLICGDCRDKEIVKNLIKKDKICQINIDVPYGVGYVESKQGFKQKLGCNKIIANDQTQSEEEYKKFNTDWLEAIKPFLSPTNSYYIFNSDKMIFALKEALNESKYKFSQLLVWIKNNSVVGRLDYLPQHELIAYGWFGKHKFKKSKDKSILFCPKPNKSKIHPTSKPISLLRRLVLNNTNINDIVYDGCAGGGSIMVACEQTKRKAYMIEIDPEYCQRIIDRYEILTNQKTNKLI
ncbi:site-specific DNA-methyltransferase [Candidatus Parcubacteria bacterium]|nr:site-specific DNA-methyltransferase [Candidatus Parcubacteria bacterium]